MKPDATLIGCCFGTNTLEELKIATTLAESERSGGLSPRVHPFVSSIEIGNLLGKCSFTLPTIYQEKTELFLESSIQLVPLLRGIGETSSLLGTRLGAHRELFEAAFAIYESTFKRNGLIPVTFDNVYFIASKFSKDQAKPLKKGSKVDFSISEYFDSVESSEDDYSGEITPGGEIKFRTKVPKKKDSN